jgi:DNA-binding transcriptional MerR regulator
MHRPKDVADQLNISPATLRLWSNNFADVLSPAAQKSTTESGTAAQRRYTDSDLAIFRHAKAHLADGLTYEETLTRLREEPPPETPPLSEILPGDSEHSVQLVTELHPVLRAFEEALRAKDETIRAKDQALAAVEATVQSKEETISALRSTIDLQERQIEDLRLRPAVATPAPVVAPTRFRWGFLNRLLLDSGLDTAGRRLDTETTVDEKP